MMAVVAAVEVVGVSLGFSLGITLCECLRCITLRTLRGHDCLYFCRCHACLFLSCFTLSPVVSVAIGIWVPVVSSVSVVTGVARISVISVMGVGTSVSVIAVEKGVSVSLGLGFGLRSGHGNAHKQ